MILCPLSLCICTLKMPQIQFKNILERIIHLPWLCFYTGVILMIGITMWVACLCVTMGARRTWWGCKKGCTYHMSIYNNGYALHVPATSSVVLRTMKRTAYRAKRAGTLFCRWLWQIPLCLWTMTQSWNVLNKFSYFFVWTNIYYLQ